MSALVAGWLVDTFVWTGALILAVLLLRRPVARWFGPQVAYALWALPCLRLLLPPIVLPASMAPVAETEMLTLSAAPLPEASAPATLTWVEPLLLTLWLGGAAIFLVWRLRDYRRMRAHLLAQARPVGEAGKVRLVETSPASAPVAFGLFDKVVALPPGFMAHYDRDARDLAIAHELAHHRGHDLLANMAAQALLALHWFNPLAWLGWRAMRSDQEAACDARVMAGRTRPERAAYAQVIAGFARGQDFALAAPMACPMLGDKSIVHRLKSLTRGDCARSRRLTGVAALALCAVALPLTASVSYASPEAPPLPPVPPIPPAAPLPPEAPMAPHAELISAEYDAAQTEIDAAIAEAHAAQAEADAAGAAALAEAAAAMASTPVVEEACDGDEPVSEHTRADGRRVVRICHAAIARQASRGLEQARAAVAGQSGLPDETRAEILRDLDREIEQLRNPRKVAFAPAPDNGVTLTLRVPTRAGASLHLASVVANGAQARAITITLPLVPTVDVPAPPARSAGRTV